MRVCLFVLRKSPWILASLSLCLLLVVSQEPYADLLRSFFPSAAKKVYSYVKLPMPNSDETLTIFKVFSEGTLSLEALFESEGRIIERKRVVLPQSQNAHFNFRGNFTDLVMSDFDADGKLEVLAPTYDLDLIPRLNVYRMDPESREFIKLGPGSFSLFQ
jgi:hypothetical protein